MVARRSLVRRAPAAVVLAAVALTGVVGSGPAGAAGGNGNASSGVMPASAQPLGYSRADMTGLLALFTTSGNNQVYYPDTPFQILYTDPPRTEARFVRDDLETPCDLSDQPCGLFFTQAGTNEYSNSLTVRAGTKFFIPVDNADDSPPIVGTFPTSNAGAKTYLFDPLQVGGRDFAVIIDGVSTPLGPAYVAGPVETEPLFDGGGTHMITIGAFLTPMTPGQHTVRITGGYYGQGIADTYGIAFIAEDFTYQVTVTA
jgi:hypothetical protein